jgi:hypothetical protein
MTLSSDISTTSTALSDIKQAIIAKGVTPSGNITTYAAAITGIPTGGDYQLHRIKDDSNNEIGTAFMEFKDGNGDKYTVVCLDAQYRSNTSLGLAWCSNESAVTNMPQYNLNLSHWWYDNATETATQNTQLIIDYCSANNYTSASCSHCRSKSFVINGVTYYGQLPNMREVFDMWRRRVEIQSMDTSSNGFGDFKSNRTIWSSSQYSNSAAWHITLYGIISYDSKDSRALVAPVLEIPL